MFDRVAIIGPGLIGGSIGLALRRRQLAAAVVGIGRREESLQAALDVGAIDQAALDVPEGVAGADLVVLATPIRAFGPVMSAAAPSLASGSVLSDVASTKVQVINTIRSSLQQRPDVSYVPAHPMAGSEKRGPLAAQADLFEGSVCIVTPLEKPVEAAGQRVIALWEALGARVIRMEAEAHDRLVARISHLPHLAAAALMAVIEDDEARLSGGGLRDTTRVASGDPRLWVDICRTNRGQIHRALTDYIELLREAADAVESGDMQSLSRLLGEAKQKRDRTIAESANHPPEQC